LPTTGSPLPLIALIGFLSIITAGVVKCAAAIASK
jgi:LPXTG-motif cell wall-anchored protein